MKNSIKISVQGKVQGVGFRYAAQLMAQKMGVMGFVQNMPDKSVLIEAEAEEFALELYLKWCKTGPSRARVDKVLTNDIPLQGYTTFEVR